MDRWNGIVRVVLSSRSHFNVAASVSFSPSTKTLTVPAANAIFFTGDRVEGTGNPVIERLSNAQNIAQILVSKFAKLGISINAWVVEASTFNGPFAVYKEFIPCVNSLGEPKSYNPDGFPASTSTVSLLSKCLNEVKKVVIERGERPQTEACISSSHQPKTILFGFSKGGTVINQLVAELADASNAENCVECEIIPNSPESLLCNISEIHYVDVGLNSAGAYITDDSMIKKIVDSVSHRAGEIRFKLHGTPRQWCDSRRPWIRREKDKFLQLLEDANQKTAGRIQVCDRLYLANMSPNLQMHFEIIEIMDVS